MPLNIFKQMYLARPTEDLGINSIFVLIGHVNKGYFSLLAQTGHGNKLTTSFYLIDMTSLYFSTLSLQNTKQIS